ncbi:Tyrosine recombinase XerD [subsurface metagenome]
MAKINSKTSPNTQKRNNSKINNKEIKYLKREQWLQLIESIDNYRDKLIVKLLYSTGMRVGELARLRVEDIDFQERFIHIPAENTKTNTARTVIGPKEVLSDISAYLKMARIKRGRLFRLTVRRIQQLMKKYAQRANLEASPHTLRHTHIVHALLDRIPITAVQKQVGHKRLATTQIYSNLAPEQVREAYEKR